jgi:hypothetical protein
LPFIEISTHDKSNSEYYAVTLMSIQSHMQLLAITTTEAGAFH